MIGTIINAAVIALGGGLGILLGDKIPQRITQSLTMILALCVMVIGIINALEVESIVRVMICLVIGTILGEIINIEKHIDQLGNRLKKLLEKNEKKSGDFTQAFLTSSLLYCVGSMAIMGSLDAGIKNDYSILLSKSLIDAITAMGLAATMGVGVVFSAGMVFLYQGAITLLAKYLQPFLGVHIVSEMSAVGGILLIGMSINMMKLSKQPIRLGNMLIAIFLPILYLNFS